MVVNQKRNKRMIKAINKFKKAKPKLLLGLKYLLPKNRDQSLIITK